MFDVPNAYDGTYDDYIAGGGITYLVNGTGYGAGDSVFDLFALTVYDKPGYYRQTINAYTPSVDAGNKPIFIDNIKGEYQYPINGTYSYVKIDGDTRTEIASATYTMPSNELQYFRPSEGAIVPTDIELPEHHNIIMYVKDIDDLNIETDVPNHMTDEDKTNIIRKKVMIGAQDEMIAPFNHTDYERNIWGDFRVTEENTAILADASGGIYYKVDGHNGFSINTQYGGAPQKLLSFNGEHIIKCGVMSSGTSDAWKYISIDSEERAQNLWNGISPGRLNEFKFAPLCIFGTYNLDESKTPDDVIALGYQDALNQIGYQTGTRYAVKQIDIEEVYVDHDGGNIFDNKRLKHRLVTNTDNNGVNCLFDTITGTTYYPYNGTLDVYTGPAEPEPPVVPDVSILTDTYIKPSAGAIVPTDIKYTAYTIITMDIKDMDNFDEELGSDVTGEAALNVVKSRVMIGAQPHTIAPFNHLDYERRLPDLEINDENKSYLGDSSIGLFFGFGQEGVYKRYSIKTGPAHPAIPSLTGEHRIEIGLRTRHDYWMAPDYYFLEYSFIIDNQPESSDITYQIKYPFEWFNNATKSPICIFGTYNLDESKTPDDIIAMGYQNALNEIGYTTGVRFGVKKIEIKQFNYDRILTEKYSLVPARDKDGNICLYDEVNNKSYYSYNGTLDEYTGPVEPEPPVDPEPPVTPDVSILTDTYVKASADAIVPTDIKLPVYHSITMHVKDIEDVVTEGVDPGSLPLEEKLNLVRKKVMIGAQGELIAPFDHVDYESNFQFDMPVNEENTAILADASGGIYYKVGGNMTSHNGFSIVTSNGGTPQKLTSFNGEHIIKCGVRMADSNSVWKFISIDSEDEAQQLWNGVSSDRLNGFSYAPLCVFGTYNSDESKKPDDVIALGYENALNQIGYTTGVRYSVKQIDIAELNADGSMTTKHSLVPARDSNGTICLYDTVSNKSYYPYYGTLDEYTGPAEPEPPVDPEPPVTPDISQILTNTYLKPSAGAIVPTDIKFTSLTNVTMHVKGFDDFKNPSNLDSIAMIGAQPNLIVSPTNDRDSTIGIYFNGCGNVLRFTNDPMDIKLTTHAKHVITVGYDPMDINNININDDREMIKKISIENPENYLGPGKINNRVGSTPTAIYKFVDDQMTTPICIFGNYNNKESMTPDDVIALGYEKALSQIGYVTGVRYGVKQIDIAVRNTDGSMTTTHSLVPARDVNDTICLYDTVTEKSYYPFHGTLDII